MKKEYTKPVLYAETYELLEHIALNCNTGVEGVVVNMREDTCYYSDNGLVLYKDTTAECKSSYNELMDGSWENYFNNIFSQGVAKCYNAFATGNPFYS